MDKLQIDRVSELLGDKQQAIVIVVHTNPDGDAIGSALGLHSCLQDQSFHNVCVVSPNAYADFLHWMPGNDLVIIAEDHPGKARDCIAAADVLFCLDFNGFARAEPLAKALLTSKARKVMIDHHPQPDDECFDVVFSDIRVSSTAELVYKVTAALYGSESITHNIAVCLYAGILTDTGSFSYGCNNPETFEIVARLVDKGVDCAKVNRLIYSTYSVDRMRLLGYCLSEKLNVVDGTNAAFISLSADDLETFNYREGDTEGVVNYALSIQGMQLAALFIERDDHVKVSLRSVGNVDVNRIARRHYHGGGHLNAAGGKSFHGLQETLDRFAALAGKGFNLE